MLPVPSSRFGEGVRSMGTRIRRPLVAALCAVMVTVLAGCSKPDGVDGNLTNNWPAFAQAKTPVPVAGVCYSAEFDTTWSGPFEPVDCAKTHHTETTYVGTFT